ncbi:MAG: glycosyltransferase family 4 protein [Acidobacteriota bacterium]
MSGADPSLRVLELETFGRGGLIHYAYNLSCALAERGHRVTLWTTRGYELDGHAPLPAGLRLETSLARWSQGGRRRVGRRIGSRFGPGVGPQLEALVDAVRVAWSLRRRRPDVVHLHSTNTSAIAFLACLRLAVLLGWAPRATRLAITAHVVTPHERGRLDRFIFGTLFRLADLVVAHSEVDRGRLERELGVVRSRIVVLPHGEYGFFERLHGAPPTRAEARRVLDLADDEEVALFFGYVREYKGLDLLLDAWPSVAEVRPRARLVIAGEAGRLPTARRRELEEQARRLGARVHFGYVPFDDVPRYFAAADLLVMPYRHISQSGVLYLALAQGVPVVATRVGALPEMLTDGASALLVQPEDSTALAAALARALGDASLRARLAAGGREVAAAHSWPSIAERTADAFARL